MNNAKVSHLIAVVLFTAGAVVEYFSSNPALASKLHVTSGVLVLAGFVVALISKELFGTPIPPNPSSVVVNAPSAGGVVQTETINEIPATVVVADEEKKS